MLLPAEAFKTIVRYTPLISIDLVVYNTVGQVLLGQRLNRPAQGDWFVPGGRILKAEKTADAFRRLVKEELNHDMLLDDAEFMGHYEHHYSDNFSNETFSTHYVVLAHRIVLDLDLSSLPKQQHGLYQWFDVEDALVRDDVHLYTKWYLEMGER